VEKVAKHMANTKDNFGAMQRMRNQIGTLELG